MIRQGIFVCLVLCAVAGCSRQSGTGTLSQGPNPFTVMPSRALEQPSNFQTLPTPTPGAVNKADVNPLNDAVVALGGRPSAARSSSSDAALVNQASRFGRDADIRSTLAQPVGRFRLGSSELDAYAELERLRALGVKTPTAPPAP